MKPPNSSFPNTIPVELYKTVESQTKPVRIATLLVPPTEVRRDEVVYSMQEKRFSVEIRVGIDYDGTPTRMRKDDISFDPNPDVANADDLTLVVSKIVKRFNSAGVGLMY